MHAKRCSIIFIPKNIYISKRQVLEHGHRELVRGRGAHAPFFAENFIIFTENLIIFTSSPPTQINRKNCPFAQKKLTILYTWLPRFLFHKVASNEIFSDFAVD